jgi:hypothetical protein
MHRAISTRLAKRGREEDGDTMVNNDAIDEDLIEQRLHAWREYVAKEDGIRKRSGLSSGPKLPIDFLGDKADRILKTFDEK